MLAVFHEASGYLPSASCDLAARLQAAAAQLEGLYHEAQWVLDQSFPQSAQGKYLDQHAALRSIRRASATCATGLLRFGLSTAVERDIPIDKGTVCMTAEGVRFLTLEDAVLPGSRLYVDVPASAVEPGRAGNAAANTITIMAAMPAGIRACTNPEAFTGGEDQEDDTSLRERLLDSYRRLPNGANAAYYEHTALSYPGVAAATAVGRPRGVGSVDVYVATISGKPEPELFAAINDYLQEKREISVDLQVKSPELVPVNIQAAIRPAQGSTFAEARAAADKAIREAFTGELLGRGLTLAFLGNLLYDLPEVENYHFQSPNKDMAASPTILPTLGTVTITELEA